MSYGQVTQEWISTYDGEPSLRDAASSTYVDNSGNVFVTGARATGYINPDNPSEGMTYECVLIKYNADGIEQWTQTFQAGSNLYSQGVGVKGDSNGNIIICGLFSTEYSSTDFQHLYDAFIAKYDTNGALLWSQNYGTPNLTESFNKIMIDNQNNIYITGDGNFVSSNSYDGLIAKYSSSGTQLWLHQYDYYNSTEEDTDLTQGIYLDSNSNLFVSVTSFRLIETEIEFSYESKITVLKYNTDGVLQFAYVDPAINVSAGKDLKLDSLGNIIVVGTKILENIEYPGNKCLTIKLNPSGEFVWEQVYLFRDNSFGQYVEIDANNNIYVTAATYRSISSVSNPTETISLTNVLLLKYDTQGEEILFHEFISNLASSYDEAVSTKMDAQGNLYLAIASTEVWTFEIPADFNYSVIKYNSNFEQQWLQTYGNVGYETDDFPTDLQIDASNNIYVVGQNDAIGASMDITTIKYSQENLANQTFDKNGLSVYPNPINDVLNISNSKEISRVTINNILGQEVLSKAINSNQSCIDVSGLKSGNYFAKITSNGKTEVIKIIKE